MAIVVADTSAWVAYLRGEGMERLELALEAASLKLPAMVKLELLGSPLSKKERKNLEYLLAQIPVISLESGQASRAAEMKADLEGLGINISARDAHILQCAKDEKALFLTSDPLFLRLEKVCGLRIVV